MNFAAGCRLPVSTPGSLTENMNHTALGVEFNNITVKL
jgi:hypothetical protein